MRDVRTASTSPRRLHINWSHKDLINDYTFGIIREFIESSFGISILDLSTTFIFVAIDQREMHSLLSKTRSLKVLHIVCCPQQASHMSWMPGAGAGGGYGQNAPHIDCGSEVGISKFVSVVPRLLKMVSRECEQMRRIDLHVEKHLLDFARKAEMLQFVKVCRVALKQVDEFSCVMPGVDVSSLREQLGAWGEEAERRCELSDAGWRK